METYKELPNDYYIEQSVLASIMIYKDTTSYAIDNLEASDFYDNQHKLIYRAIQNLYIKNQTIDILTIKHELDNDLEKAGGFDYLTTVFTVERVSINIKDHINILKNLSKKRSLIIACNEILNLSHTTNNSDELILKAQERIFKLSQEKQDDFFVHIKDVFKNTVKEIEQVNKNKGGIRGTSTGFKSLDNVLSGLNKSDLVLLAARPAMGKTSFALNICEHFAVNEQKSVALFSLEMSNIQLSQKLLASETLINLERILSGNIKEDEWGKIIHGIKKLSQSKIYIDDTPGISPMKILSKCRRLKMSKGIDLIMIDYLQLMSSDRGGESRQQEISTISRHLKLLAREMDCPVIALSQLSRAPEQRANHRPILSDLRDSGAIEQDADIVAFIYRDEYYSTEEEPTDKPGIAEIIIAKNRSGPTSTVELKWLGDYTKFVDLRK